MHRVFELMHQAEEAHPADDFFEGARASIRSSQRARAYCECYERALRELDDRSWQVLRSKAVTHFLDHRPGQTKQGFFNQLNDSIAYRYLRQLGHSQVSIIEESGSRCPDISFVDGRQQKFCEVKTIGISDDEINRRKGLRAFSAGYHRLEQGFFDKLGSDIDIAWSQIQAYGSHGLVYVLITFDDFTMTYYSEHRQQIQRFLQSHPVSDVYVKAGLLGRRCVRGRSSTRVPNPSFQRTASPPLN